jgi:D-3-phosphoglycerate dehydrogenase
MSARPTVFIAQSTMDAEAIPILEDGSTIVWGLPEDLRVRPVNAAARAAQLSSIRESLLEVVSDVDAIFGFFPYDSHLIEAATSLRVIISPTSGTDHVDIDAATANGVAVVNAAGANYVQVAEHVIGLALSLLKLIAIPDRAAHRDSRQTTNAELFDSVGLPTILSGRTIGVIGFGFIGREVSRIASQGFRMKVLAFDPYYDSVEARRLGATLVPDLATLMVDSDVVSVTCPLTSETRGLIDAQQLGLMKPSAVLVNCSRGGTVVTDDLLAALRSGTIAGAGLDVTDPEPLPPGHELFALDNVVLTPHIAGISAESLVQQSVQSARDGMLVLRGKRPFHLVNPEVWPRLRAAARH